MTLPFLRSDLADFAAYVPHPGSADDPLPESVDHLDTNECPYDLPEHVKGKLAWQYQHAIAANRYPDGEHLALKGAIATYVAESAGLPAASLTPAHISVGNGSDELIRSLLIATCGAGQGSILVANPTFSMYGILARTLGIPVVTVGRHEDNFEVDLTAAQAALEHPQAAPIRMIFMVHPNSPTANALTPAELDWLRQVPADVLVVVDEAYFEFSQHTTVADCLQRLNWVVLRTFSKAFRLAAHRVGYAVANPTLIQVLEKVRLPYNLPSLSLAAAQLALNHRQELLEAIPLLLAERNKLLTTLAQTTSLCIWPSAANFLYVRPQISQETLSKEQLSRDLSQELETLFHRLRSAGTLVRQTGGGLRITVGTPEENQRTVRHLQQVLGKG